MQKLKGLPSMTTGTAKSEQRLTLPTKPFRCAKPLVYLLKMES